MSWLGLCGVDPRGQVVLARHAPQGVTLRNYQDFGVFDLWGEIAKLPAIQGGAEAVRATGTDGGACTGACTKTRPGGCKSGRKWPDSAKVMSPRHKQKTLQNKGFPASNQLGATGFEPATSCSQSRRATGLRHAPCATPAYHRIVPGQAD